ncbi:MAG: ATPase, T2SS/T4P/T4SS family [Candidatus Liptonbacteria bacterium]
MTNDQLIQAIREKSFLPEPALAKLAREAKLSGRSVEELVYEQRLLADDRLTEIKSSVLGVPYQKINFAILDEAVLQFMPEGTARSYQVAPLQKEGNMLIVGMVHPDDAKAQDALKFIASRQGVGLGVYLISASDWQEVMHRYSPLNAGIEKAVQSLSGKMAQFSAPGRRVVHLDEDLTHGAEEAPIIKIVSDIFREALQVGASDIHIEPQQRYLRIRFRVDGDLKEVASLPAQLAQPVISRIKVISNLKIDEMRIPQDGRFQTIILDREVDFRVATFPTPLGEKMAVRVLDPSTGLRTLEQLGLAGHNAEVVQEGLRKPFGMILLSGPTGSGKTTTLYALLQELNMEDVNIVSLEDPVEYFVGGINQSQVRPEIGYDFASGLRQILRQDPDVIMVGEIRDNETAALAIQAALTGHIVLSTLHTNNAAGVIPRLLDMKIEPFLLPVSLNIMLSQRLVGLLCAECRKEEEAPPDMQEIIDRSLAGLSPEARGGFKKPYKIYHASGCAKCKNRGIAGRIAIFEAMRMTPELKNIIYEGGANIQKIQKEAQNQKMVEIRQDGVIKALQGLVSMEEVLRVTSEM